MLLCLLLVRLLLVTEEARVGFRMAVTSTAAATAAAAVTATATATTTAATTGAARCQRLDGQWTFFVVVAAVRRPIWMASLDLIAERVGFVKSFMVAHLHGGGCGLSIRMSAGTAKLGVRRRRTRRFLLLAAVLAAFTLGRRETRQL